MVDGSDILTDASVLMPEWANVLNVPADLADGDADTLAGLSCATGEIASWDGSSSWVCTSDNTLEWADVELLLNNNPVDLQSRPVVIT